MIKAQLRYSILHAPPEVSPLKFRGWIRKEAESVQTMATGKDDIILIRLFLLEKIVFGLGMKKIDDILQGVVDKCPNIARIELEPLTRALTAEEMQEAAQDAQETLEALSSKMAETVEQGEQNLR